MENLKRIKRIDGLRGIAILFVLFFHLDIKYFDGGFIGVDIFFVISGYVITLYLKNNYLNNSLSLKIFYYKRIRRILPPLLLVNIIVLFLGYFILSPQLYNETSWSSLGSIFSFSNFIFWRENGYFDFDSSFKPLLHTWSLSVEEQFYLFWPLFFIFFFKKFKNSNFYIYLFFIFMISANIIINQIFSNGFTYFKFLKNIFANGEATIFYLLPFRIFEFLMGSFFVFNNFKLKSNVLTILSIFLILISMLTFKSDTVFPIYNSIFFLLSTSLLIINDSKFNQILFENKVIIFFGKISYSLYLIHWPFIVYWKYLDLSFLIFDKFLIFLICTFLSYTMFLFLENKLKNIDINVFIRKFSQYLFFIVICLTLVNFYIIKNDGIPKRYFKNNKILTEDKKFITDNINNSELIWNNYSSNSQLFIGKGIFDKYVHHARNQHQNIIDPEKKSLVILGDSMASDFFNILLKIKFLEEFNLIVLPQPCRFNYKELLNCEKISILKNKVKSINPEKIFFAISWQDEEINDFHHTIPHVKKLFNEDKIIFVKSKQQSKWGLNLFSKIFKFEDENLQSNTQKLSKTAILANNKISELLNDNQFIDLTNLFCKDLYCKVFDNNNYLLIYDYAHLTPKGVNFLALELEKDSKFKKILNINFEK